MPSIDYALTTKERIKERLGISVTGFDTLIDHLIANITSFIENECGGRRFKKTTYTNEIHDGDGKKYLKIKHAPINSISSFQYNGGTVSSPVWTNFLADDYQLLDKEGMIYVAGGMLRGLRNIRVTYDAGFLIDFANETDTTKHTLPFDISGLAERLVVKEFKRREDIGKSGESIGDMTINFFADLEAEDKAVLERYKRIIFG